MLGAFQKKIAAIALTCFSFCVIGAFVVIAFALFGAFLDKFGTVIWPLALALIVSFVLKPIAEYISSKFKISPILSCIIIYAFALLGFALFLIFILPKIISDITQMLALLPDALHTLAHNLSEEFPTLKDAIVRKTTELRAELSKAIAPDSIINGLRGTIITIKKATGGIVALCSFCAAFAVVPIYLFYMLTSNFDFLAFIDKKLDFISKGAKDDIMFFVQRFSDIMITFFRGQLLIALIMGLLLGCGFFFSGVKFGFILGFCVGMLNLIPYLGTVVGLSTILPLAFLQENGGLWLVALSLGIFCLVQLLEGYYLTPKIMGERTGLHPTVIIFSVFFWGIALNGILGMILAIPLTALIVASWDRISARIRQLTLQH